MDSKRVARREVTALLKRFFEHLTGRLTTGTADLWRKVEQQLPQKLTASELESKAPPGMLRTPMQQQPVQQQQAKTSAEDGK
jgi:hypothetical protein